MCTKMYVQECSLWIFTILKTENHLNILQLEKLNKLSDDWDTMNLFLYRLFLFLIWFLDLPGNF